MNKKKVLKAIGYTWLVLASIVICTGYIGIFYFKGWKELVAVLSPFNFINYIAMFVTIYPGIWLLKRAEKQDITEKK